MMNRYIGTYLLAMLLPLVLWAQEPETLIRYVKTDGAYTNDGKSWDTAKNNIQDAINDLYDQIKNTDKQGHVYVAAGTYRPTESTESGKDGTAYTAFKIYEGITVYGGFNATTPEASPSARAFTDKNATTPYYYGKKFTHVTILDGNHTNMGDKKNLEWNETKQQYTTTFPGNSYHVVWFATKGFDDNGRAIGLSKPARLDGCTVQGGYASNRVSSSRHHNSYGGGIYMVAGSYVDNCIVTQNAATRAGGAIYLDGGGEVDHSYVRYNQTLGIGVDDGFGGGICVEGAGVVRHTVMAENVARMGGGLALLAEEEEPAEGNRYAPSAAGCVVGNNTTITEAGGVYMRYGGVLNHLAIVNNRCNGANLVYHGRRYGRSAGIYIDKYGEVFNTVCWGGEVEANSNIQYAAYTDASQTEQPRVHYSAFAQNEITDWSSTIRMDVFSLNTKNEDYANDGNYPEFINPTIRTSQEATNEAIAHFTGVGVAEKATELGVDNFAPLWQPYRNSYLRGKGVMLKEYDYALDRWETLKQASIEEDFQGTKFSPKTALGAFVTRSEGIRPYDNGTYLTLYVDPSRTSSKSISHANQDLYVGDSWNNPVGNLNDALLYFSMKEGKDGGATAKKKGRILVKEGETNTRGNYMAGNLRSSSFIMVSNVEVYGGYPKELTGTTDTGRDPVKYPTHVSGDIADDKYINNVHHLVRFGDVQNAVFDGFRLYAGNAASKAISTASSRHGGGVLVYTTSNGSTCTGNILRNCVIANCTALQGAGIYVTGLGQDLANDPHREVSLTVENCIIHNNTSIDATPSAVCARGSNTTLTLNHCTVRGNVGYGVAATEYAQVTMNNSVIHANASEAMGEVATLATDASYVLTLYTNDKANDKGTITGDYNLLDANSTTLPTEGTNNQAILTYTDNVANYPKFVNPTRNVGHSEEVDNTIYGGYPNFMPTNISPLVNAANSNGTNYNSATDITANHTRNYGGLPDVGAVENTDLPEGGTVLYVTPDGSGTKDGSSWANAIAGNTIYKVEDGTRVVEDNKDVLTINERYCGSDGNYYYANNQPYAEKSNHSKSFWTANSERNGNTRLITNNREEDYVSGLQYAVEKATASDGKITEVWVGNGTYTDWKGYVIRDKVAVYGGFPASTISNPGMKERKPLLSTSIPASKENESLTKTDYETIIQVRETSNTENLPEDLPSDMRKYVLYQPDVCLTTNSPNSEYGGNDTQSNTYRYNSANVGYVEYIGASWDGFTIQNGFINGLQNNRDGGAGVRMFRGVTLKNCIVKNNYNTASRTRGGGIYCDDGDGTSSAVINCFVINNKNKGDQSYGGGMYMIVGTSYNSLFCNNHADTEGGGIFLECATFYNNTIVNNTSNGTGGMHHWIDNGGRASKLAVYNCLFYGNSGAAVGSENADYLVPFHNCYVQTATEFKLVNGVNVIKNKIPTDAEHNNQYGVGNALANPFEDANYYFTSLNLRLAGTSACINAGKNEPNNITLPDTDVDFATRIQDCTVDIGAYEYNGAANIVPTLAGNVATYYVTQNGRGTATATDPANAACWTKLQKVLDAAGRYKYENPATQVIVKLAAFPAGGDAGYMPRRSSVTKANDPDAENPRTFSIMVPRGVEVWGGYTDDYTNESDHGFLEIKRNITTNKTTLSGLYQAEGQDVNVYHVVTFTDQTFDTEGKVTEDFLSNGEKISAMGDHDKAILDGLFITGGLADGVKAENQRGGAAVLPDYAHVRNCIVHTNKASEEGGALYMQPRSLVSGTLLVNNQSGNRGGAIYVEEPLQAQAEDVPAEQGDAKEYARVFTSTIVRNRALQGGGINFQTNLRANSVVVWGNDANMQDNIAGQLDPFSTQASSSQTLNDYPLSFSAVENQHVAGINNLQVNSEDDKGVRFSYDSDSYYALTPTSVLVRAGMRYEDYQDCLEQLPTLRQNDFAGVDRLGYANDYIDIGARAINETVHSQATSAEDLLTRLYVVSPELEIDLDLQRKLMNSSDAIYRQQGSSFANPMIRLDDALDYIRKVRKSEIENVNNTKFEIFVSRGTFYPLRTIRGEYSYSRANTYLVPEGVSIIGGMKTETGDVHYGQITTGTHEVGATAGWQDYDCSREEWLESLGSNRYNNDTRKNASQITGEVEGYWPAWEGGVAHNPVTGTVTITDSSVDYDYVQDKTIEITSIEITNNEIFRINYTYTFTYYWGFRSKSVEGQVEILSDGGDYIDNIKWSFANNEIKFSCDIYTYDKYYHHTEGSNPGIVTITGATTIAMRDSRLHYDLNNNGIIEPWEMKEQTILSGANVNSVNSENVYHVIAAIPAEQWVGKLPGTSAIEGKEEDALEEATADGTKHAETGERIMLDGLYISDGHAYGYEPNFVGSTHTYYKGGAICVNGNWVTKTTTTDGNTTQEDMFLNATEHNPLGYRNIPLTVVNCQFSNNMGGMGGAIFSNGDLEIYDCSFTQNKSMGGEDKDARYTGNGGAVNASGRLVAVNTLFANNEAEAGGYVARDDDDIQNTGGWGGAILAGEHCRLHILNCNFVRNKATNYPAIYNYVSNAGWNINGDDYSPGNKENNDYTSKEVRINNPHRVVSSIFWGNEAEGIHKSMYYGPEGNEVEHLWFCAYGEDCGLTPVSVPPTDDFDYRKVEFHFHDNNNDDNKNDDDGVTRAAYIPALFQHYYTKKFGENGTLPTDPDPAPWKVTNNIILNTENTALDGPNFINPSQTAGVAGYMAGADWMMSRINNLVDNGWTYLEQNTEGKYDDPASIQDLTGSGIYKKIADVFEENHNGFTLMPYGNQEYMYYPELTNDGTHHRKMLRISNDPNSTTNETFIDIGLYEYQHVSLTSASTDAVDLLWVAEHERQDIDGPADGHDWLHATSDLQRAIETLLSSRNGNPKEIRIIEGTYMPVYTINKNLGFHISTRSANETVVYAEKEEGNPKGIQSLTIRGGYSSEMADVYDYNKYPVHIVSAERSGVSPDKFKHLFFIEDARQRKSYKGDDNLTHTAEDEVIPITLSGLTFTNSKAVEHEHHQEHEYQGGAAIYYADQLKDNNEERTPLIAPTNGKRLTISNCIFLQNGVEENTEVPAVSIGQGGGDALIYNSLFHSNTGDPLLAWDTKVINCTFAMNGGVVKLDNPMDGKLDNPMDGYASELHNSVLWKNNQNEVLGTTEVSGLASDVTYTHNAISISEITKDESNSPLSGDNDDIMNGPNFFDPKNSDPTARDFRIKPSAVLLSGASDELFAKMVLGTADNLTTTEYQTAVAGTTDLAYFQPRSYGKGLDRGAYECHEKLNRIIYVDPNKVTRTGTGESWEQAYEYGRLQNAIDATFVYAMEAEKSEKNVAYVFVKGKREGSTDEAITLRNGVQVYGSIDPGYTHQVAETNTDGNITYTEKALTDYVTQLRTVRPGLAGTNTYRTVVKGVTTTASAYKEQTLLDGFVVSNPTPTATSAVDLKGDGTNQNLLAIRNSIIAGNTVTGENQPVVNVENGLLYNVLVQENSVQGSNVVSISAMGRMVNGTVVTDEKDKIPIYEEKKTPIVFNSISYNATYATAISPFAPYFQQGTIGYHKDKPAYLTDNHYLWYQLHDGSKKIDEGNDEITLLNGLDAFIDYDADRDILGNKRLFNGQVDMGCFETWNINSDLELDHVPAEGSVVYVQEGVNLKLNSGLSQTFSPSYLLLGKGASLYGQGARVELNYVAVEKAMPQEYEYGLLSLPYDYNVAHTVEAIINTQTDQLTETPVTSTVYTYDGEARAAHGYHFVTDNSVCWKTQTGTLPANQGVLFEAEANKTYRFTAFAPIASDRLYTEGGTETSKAVTLTQYNSTPTNGSADFTSTENMGWNLVGMPYLVNRYATHTLADDGTYQMNIPHVFYTLDSEGNYETAQSWEENSTLSLGNAFFTQTATLDATEQLQFKLPVYVQAQTIDTRALLNITSEEGSDAVQLNPDSEVTELTDFQLNYDGVKLLSMNNRLPQIYALGNRGSHLSLMGSAPVEKEISLGFYAAKSDASYTFSLPNREAFASYGGVWLKDNLTGITCNLLEEDYTLTTTRTGNHSDRLTVQIGGTAPTPSLEGWRNDNAHVVHVADGTLRLNHLQTGKSIRVYTTDGRLVHQSIATGNTHTIAVPVGTYIIIYNL